MAFLSTVIVPIGLKMLAGEKYQKITT